MNSNEIRKKFLKYFEKRGHHIVPSSSLVPEDDPSVLFTTAGMQQFKPYYIGKKDAMADFGTLNTTSSQKCLRTSDIEEVSDESHLTFFEMLGNFSLGGYFKKEAIGYAYEFITKEMNLEIDYVSVFGGDQDVPEDKESCEIWKSIGISEDKIKKRGKEDNFWGPTGDEGPCGPTTEIYVNGVEIWNVVFVEYYCHKDGKLELLKQKGVDTGMGLERLAVAMQGGVILADAINCLVGKNGNVNKKLYDVLKNSKHRVIVVTNADEKTRKEKLKGIDFEIFSLNKNPEKTNPEYFKTLLETYNLKADDVIYFDHKKENVKSAQKVGILSEQYIDEKQVGRFIQKGVFSTDLFTPLMKKIDELGHPTSKWPSGGQVKAQRIVADHIKAGVFLIADGVVPSNTERGYVLRRLIRRAVRYADILGIEEGKLSDLVDIVIQMYKDTYSSILQNIGMIRGEISEEEEKFRKTLKKGLKQFEKLVYESLNEKAHANKEISGKDAFILFSTYGFPLEMTLELAKEKEIEVDVTGFEEEMKKHQEISKAGADQKFKGGLAGHGEMEIKYHTASHLLLSALQKILRDHVIQKGSNITSERLRLDFSHPAKMTDEEKKKVENLVNEKIQESLPVTFREMSFEEARKKGASGVFEEKYGEKVRVYFIGHSTDTLPESERLQSRRQGDAFSIEICGGPHVRNTSELGHFKIKKEESVSAGVRRIKAVLE